MKTENLALRKPTWEQNPWTNKKPLKLQMRWTVNTLIVELMEANVRSP